MTREHKLALIIGFALVLTVGMLLSDHFSTARGARLAPIEDARGAFRTVAASNASTNAQPESLRQDNPAPSAPLLDRPLPEPASSPAGRDPSGARSQDAAPASSDGVKLAELAANNHKQAQRTTTFVPAAQSAEAPSNGPPRAPTRRHQVQPDDTLWSICEREYGDGSLHEQLAAYNADRLGTGGVLRVGATILLPPIHMLTGAPLPASADPSRSAQPRTYVVRQGDTLSEIALRLLGSVRRTDDIVRLNSDAIDDKDDIRAGMRLRLPQR